MIKLSRKEVNQMNNKVVFDRVSLEENNFSVLNNVSLSFKKEQIVGLVGRNGSGKTSLLSLLSSYRLPTSGKIFVDGEEVFDNEDKMKQVTFVHSKNYTEEKEPAKEKFRLSQHFRPNYDSDYANYLIELFDLPTDTPVNELSKEKQETIDLIIGLASRTSITIFDEAHLSMRTPLRKKFYQEIKKEQQNKPRLFIFSTGHVSELEFLFDDVVIMDEGRVLYHESYDEITSKGVIVAGISEHMDEVDKIVEPYEQIKEENLWKAKAITIYGKEIDELKEEVKGLDVELIQPSLQVLLKHLVEEKKNVK